MRNFLRGGLLLAAILFISQVSTRAQIYDLPCPAGSSPAPQSMQTAVPQTGHIRANVCVDANGIMTWQGNLGTVALGTASGPSVNVQNFGAKGDARSVQDCAVTNNSPIVTSNTAHFLTNAKVGQIFFAIDPSAPAIRIPFNQAYPMATITSIDSDTQIHVSTNANNTISPNNCVWGTQEEDSSFLAARNASGAIAGGAPGGTLNVNSGPTTNISVQNIYIPPGGYIFKQTAFACVSSSDPLTLICPNFIGAGSNKVTFYMEPTANTFLIQYGSAGSSGPNGIQVSGFTVTSMAMPLSIPNGGFPAGLIYIAARGFDFYDVNLLKLGATTINASSGLILCAGCQDGSFRSLYMQSGAVNGNTPWFTCTSGCGAGVTVRDSFISNQNGSANVLLNGTDFRSPTGSAITFEGVFIDECVNPSNGSCFDLASGQANFIGGNVFGTTNAMHVGSGSTLWLTDSNLGRFSNGGVGNAIAIDATGTVYATGNTLRGNSTGFVLTGPSTANYFDAGLNTYQNCLNGSCTTITAAQYTTQFATGGIVPQTSIQMPTNTVYAVGGNLLATAQNLATIPLTVNEQLKSVTAQSGGTTPANSACATPPVITFSDGTRSATLTMTSGKTTWSSAVDSYPTANQVFASGTTLTISIGANTCATPPVNVSVSYNLQSVLNP